MGFGTEADFDVLIESTVPCCACLNASAGSVKYDQFPRSALPEKIVLP